MVVAESADALSVGDPAPDFELPGVDGETHRLADYAEHEALLVVFTCNHCPYAVAKIEALNRLANEYDDVAVVGVNPNDDEQKPEDSFERMMELVEDGTIDYDAYLRDASQSVARAFGATCTPDPFLFANEGGTFVLAHHGRLDDAMSPDESPSGQPGFEMAAAIEDVLAGREVAVEAVPSRGCSIKWLNES